MLVHFVSQSNVNGRFVRFDTCRWILGFIFIVLFFFSPSLTAFIQTLLRLRSSGTTDIFVVLGSDGMNIFGP